MAETVRETGPPEPPPAPQEVPRQTVPRSEPAGETMHTESQADAREQADTALRAEYADATGQPDDGGRGHTGGATVGPPRRAEPVTSRETDATDREAPVQGQEGTAQPAEADEARDVPQPRGAPTGQHEQAGPTVAQEYTVATRPDTATAPPPAGRWEVPDTPRHHGDRFNEKYERWVRESTGGPPDREYKVERGGELAWFDNTVTETRGGQPTEVLVDAKGRYSQFIDPDTGDWKKWWSQSAEGGMPAMMDTARRQVRAADGRPVEWYCAERDSARQFNREFANNDDLAGRIRAVYKPMPGEEG